jgi:hypothetical protein
LDGTPVIDVDRGGKITWHGPGQLVGYPIVRLPESLLVVDYVRRLEEAMIAMFADYGLSTGRIRGRSGVWLAGDAERVERKIAAIGIRVAAGTTMHGFAINVDPDLGWFGATWHSRSLYSRRTLDRHRRRPPLTGSRLARPDPPGSVASPAVVRSQRKLAEMGGRTTVPVVLLAIIGFCIGLLTRHTAGAIGLLLASVVVGSSCRRSFVADLSSPRRHLSLMPLTALPAT